MVEYNIEPTIAYALQVQIEALEALRAKVKANPNDVAACKELSMASKRLAYLIEKYELEKRVEALEDGRQP